MGDRAVVRTCLSSARKSV